MECGSLLPLFFFLDVLQTLTQLVLPKHLFWNLPPTKCKFHKPFILIFMQIGGVYPPRIARCSSLKTDNWELTTENGQSARSAKWPSDPEFTNTYNEQRTIIGVRESLSLSPPTNPRSSSSPRGKSFPSRPARASVRPG